MSDSPSLQRNMSTVKWEDFVEDILDLTPHPGCNRHQQDYDIFRLGYPDLNLDLPLLGVG